MSSSWRAEIRREDVAHRRNEREAKMRQKDLERQLKERAKLSSLEQAKLEVEAYDNALEVLLSVHKEQHTPTDWRKYASSLPPHAPPRLACHELTELLNQAVSETFHSPEASDTGLEEACALDQGDYEVVRTEYEKELAHWKSMRSLSQRVLSGEAHAYTEAVVKFPNLAEISNLGSAIHMTVHDAKLVECTLKVNGRDAIPSDVKSLTAAGKLTVKAMPKAKFHEIYQGYVCGCILRLAREIFALLPVETLLLTATVNGNDSRTGRAAELPVLSMAAPRAVIEHLDFEHLNPSDALANFQHRGDVIGSKKSDAFERIEPLTPQEIASTNPATMDLTPLVSHVRQFRTELDPLLKRANLQPSYQAQEVN